MFDICAINFYAEINLNCRQLSRGDVKLVKISRIIYQFISDIIYPQISLYNSSMKGTGCCNEWI